MSVSLKLYFQVRCQSTLKGGELGVKSMMIFGPHGLLIAIFLGNRCDLLPLQFSWAAEGTYETRTISQGVTWVKTPQWGPEQKAFVFCINQRGLNWWWKEYKKIF